MTSHDPLTAALVGAVWVLHASGPSALEGALELLESSGARARPLVGSLASRALLTLEAEAARTAFPPLVSLAGYLGVDVRSLSPRARADLVREVFASKGVDLIEVTPDGIPLPGGVPPEPRSQRHGPPPPAPPSFLPGDPAPAGLGVRQVHEERGCRGAGVRVAIVERGWDLAAPRLPAARIRLLCNDTLGHRLHGAAVLAVLCAAPDSDGIGGVAPDLDEVLLAAEGAAAWPGLDLAADAIVAAAAALRPGDVLLLETQREEGGLGWPAEVSTPILHAIRLATARGVVVVEAAGNGGGDLDAFVTADGRRPFVEGEREGVDSGAVLVGACDGPPRWRMGAGATRGARLDVVAPGDGVGIPGGGARRSGGRDDAVEGPNRGAALPRLTGTSAAAVLVAGCVALLQSARKAAGLRVLTPMEVRDRLRDPRRGTAVAGCRRPCPDLARLMGS